MNTLTSKGLYLDNACFGAGMILTAVKPYKEYQDGKATDNVAGYKYCVVLPARSYEVLEIKVAGETASSGLSPLRLLCGNCVR